MSDNYTELLNELSTDVEQNTEFIDDCEPICIVGREIQMPKSEVYAVCCDANSQILTFQIDRFVDGVDLYSKATSIKFKNAIGQSDRANPHTVFVSDDKLTFTWVLDARVTAGDGTVTFQVEFIDIDNSGTYIYQTKMQTFEVIPTLDVDGNIEEPTPTWVQQTTARLRYLENAVQAIKSYESIKGYEDEIDEYVEPGWYQIVDDTRNKEFYGGYNEWQLFVYNADTTQFYGLGHADDIVQYKLSSSGISYRTRTKVGDMSGYSYYWNDWIIIGSGGYITEADKAEIIEEAKKEVAEEMSDELDKKLDAGTETNYISKLEFTGMQGNPENGYLTQRLVITDKSGKLETLLVLGVDLQPKKDSANPITSGAVHQSIQEVNMKFNDFEYRKQDATTLELLTDQETYVFDFSDNYNKEVRCHSVDTVSIIFRDDEYAPDYISGLSFNSGNTPTSFDYTASGIINWVGTDCVNDNGLSIFRPSANTHYDVVFYFNGAQFIGLVNGFVPASGNVVSE